MFKFGLLTTLFYKIFNLFFGKTYLWQKFSIFKLGLLPQLFDKFLCGKPLFSTLPPVSAEKFENGFIDGTRVGPMCHNDFESMDISDEKYKELVKNGNISENWNVFKFCLMQLKAPDFF